MSVLGNPPIRPPARTTVETDPEFRRRIRYIAGRDPAEYTGGLLDLVAEEFNLRRLTAAECKFYGYP